MKGYLSVAVVDAKNLSESKAAPFAIVSVGSKEQRTKPVKVTSRSVAWNEEFAFEVEISAKSIANIIIVDSMDNDLLGEVALNFEKMAKENRSVDNYFEFKNKAGKTRGEVRVKLWFTPGEQRANTGAAAPPPVAMPPSAPPPPQHIYTDPIPTPPNYAPGAYAYGQPVPAESLYPVPPTYVPPPQSAYAYSSNSASAPPAPNDIAMAATPYPYGGPANPPSGPPQPGSYPSGPPQPGSHPHQPGYHAGEPQPTAYAPQPGSYPYQPNSYPHPPASYHAAEPQPTAYVPQPGSYSAGTTAASGRFTPTSAPTSVPTSAPASGAMVPAAPAAAAFMPVDVPAPPESGKKKKAPVGEKTSVGTGAVIGGIMGGIPGAALGAVAGKVAHNYMKKKATNGGKP